MDENKLEFILTLNSDILKNKKINRAYFFSLQKGSGKNLKIEYDNKIYKFKRNDIDKDTYYLYSLDNSDDTCVTIMIDEKDKIAEIHSISTDNKYCLDDKLTNEKYGSNLLKLTLSMLKKYKNKFGINLITLRDNSVKKCGKYTISLPIMLTLLSGETWYGKYGFRPIERISYETTEWQLDKISLEKYKKNKDIIKNIKLENVNFKKIFNKAELSEDFIKETYKFIKENKSLLLKTYLSLLLKDFNKNCESFYKFYRILYDEIGLYLIDNKYYGLFIN